MANAAAGVTWFAHDKQHIPFVMPFVITRPRDFSSNTINDPYGFPGGGAW